MTALPVPPPGRALTIAEYAVLPEDDQYRWELLEGNLVMSPSPIPAHQSAIWRLCAQLDAQLPPDLVVVPDVDIDLQLAPADQPGTSRRPDVVVVDRAEYDRVDAEGGILRAAHVRLVVEILSPGSKRTDRIIKRTEYADASIGHYWILDLQDPVSLVADHLGGELGYVEGSEATGTFTATEPFPVTIDLDRLA